MEDKFVPFGVQISLAIEKIQLPVQKPCSKKSKALQPSNDLAPQCAEVEADGLTVSETTAPSP